MADAQRSALIVSAHSADFVWRAGGAVALHAEKGYRVKVVCLSFGERGESAKLWRQSGMTLEKVKAARRAESEKAADILGAAEIEFWDIGDYPMRITDEITYRMADVFRALKPAFACSHSLHDPYNFDHGLATHLVQEARIVAQAMGYKPGERHIGAIPIFLYEPHQTELCGFKPDVFIDITPVWEKKRKAIEAMTGQEYLWEYYTRVGLNRGLQAKRNSFNEKVGYAEAYQRLFPQLQDVLA